MPLSNYALELTGFKKIPEEASIVAKFYGLHVYKTGGLSLADDTSPLFSWGLDGTEFQFAFGNNLNSVCRLLTNDDFSDDLETWEKEKECQPPYLVVLLGPTPPHTATNCWTKRESETLLTYEAFLNARADLRATKSAILPRFLTGLACEFQKSLGVIGFDFVHSTAFGVTDQGENVHDLGLSVFGRGTVTVNIDDAALSDGMASAKSIAEQVNYKAAKFFEQGMREKDELKAFLFLFLSMETTTHKTFNRIDHKAHIESLFQPDDRIAPEARALFEIRKEFMKDLTPRFIWCATCVWKGISSDDISEFKSLKKVRDDIAHGKVISPEYCDVERARKLAQRVLSQR